MEHRINSKQFLKATISESGVEKWTQERLGRGKRQRKERKRRVGQVIERGGETHTRIVDLEPLLHDCLCRDVIVSYPWLA